MQGKKIILGMGATGISVANFLQSKNICFDICDSNSTNIVKFKNDYPNAKFFLQDNSKQANFLNEIDFNEYDEIIASPGVDLNKNSMALKARELGINIVGDIEIFARFAKAPIIAITGSNGKSTVTTLTGELLQQTGFKVGVGGNLGKPALDLLEQEVDFFVLELSSFQLDTCFSLKPFIACILNITPDHLDRHLSMQNYINAKQKIYANAQNIVYFRSDSNTYPQKTQINDQKALSAIHFWSFDLDKPQNSQEFGVLIENNKLILARGDEQIISSDQLALAGKIGILNSLVALIFAQILKLDKSKVLQLLQTFSGLEHRCKKVAHKGGIDFFDDSKATNVGATLAGVENLTLEYKNIFLILGGEGKGQNFAPLKNMQNIKSIAIFGKDKQEIFDELQHNFDCNLTQNLCESVFLLTNLAKSGDAVLLSPACASLDMFKNYQQRGEEFYKCVMQLD